ncbi:PfkB family carbohydrate kinase, partial [Myxococcota bacterium]|nr:PfkB family carbohydrate kinase [Myxococcota bacterium]
TLRLLHRRFGGTPVVTQGEKGALALVRGKFLKVPPRRARVVDTTGAGDAFHGAFAAALAQGAEIPTALRRASRRAAAACRHLGGCPPL